MIAKNIIPPIIEIIIIQVFDFVLWIVSGSLSLCSSVIGGILYVWIIFYEDVGIILSISVSSIEGTEVREFKDDWGEVWRGGGLPDFPMKLKVS